METSTSHPWKNWIFVMRRVDELESNQKSQQYLPLVGLPITTITPSPCVEDEVQVIEMPASAMTSSQSQSCPSIYQQFRIEHRFFVPAVFEIGLEYASPLILQELISPSMKEKYPSINESAWIKSILHHYRKKTGSAVVEFGNV